MRLKTFIRNIYESPLVDYSFMGDDKPDSLRPVTIDLAKSAGAKNKAIRMFSKTPFNIRVVFLNKSFDAHSTWGTKMPLRKSDIGKKGSTLNGTITGYEHNVMGIEIPEDLKPYLKAYNRAYDYSGMGEMAMKYRFAETLGFPRVKMPYRGFILLDNGKAIAAGDENTVETRWKPNLKPGQEIRPRMVDSSFKAQLTKHERWKKKFEELSAIFDRMEDEIPLQVRTANAQDLTAPGHGVEADPNAITFVINSDDGDGFVPFTPWMIAHRMGHVFAYVGGPLGTLIGLFQSALGELIVSLDQFRQEIFVSDSVLNGVLAKIGKFKSARDLSFGDLGEFFLDCFAQFLIQGKTSFNPVDSETIRGIIARRDRARYGTPADQPYDESRSFKIPPEKVAAFNQGIKNVENMLNEKFYKLLSIQVGKVVAI